MMTYLKQLKCIFLIVALNVALVGTSVYAQVQLSPFIMASTGNYSSGAGITLSSTVGECMVQTFSSPALFITQGFQQPSSDTLVGVPLDSIKIYSGITPNGDGHNDEWIITYIDQYKSNEVSIFNRWGNQVWHAFSYNNKDIVWKGKDHNELPLPDATYYYVIIIDGQEHKGWVELTH